MDEQPKRVIGKPFEPGNPGRPKGSRHKLGEAFVSALQADFEKGGVAAIEAVRDKDPSTYVRVLASLLPKEVALTAPLQDMTDDELHAAIDAVRVAVASGVAGPGNGSGAAPVGKPH